LSNNISNWNKETHVFIVKIAILMVRLRVSYSLKVHEDYKVLL
jgi:hypothetical protein